MKHVNNNFMRMGFLVLVFAFIISIVPAKVFAVSSPTIGSITPAFGVVNGGTSITITGTNFASGATVTVGGAAATSIVVVSATQITALTPSGVAGANNVVVTNTDTGTVTSAGGFTYVATPSAVDLGTAANFTVFSNTGISNTGTTSITGDIGTGPGVTSTAITGFALSAPPTTYSVSSLVTGKVYAYDYNVPTPTKEQNASSDLTTAYNNAQAAATTVLDAGSCVSGTCNLGGLTLAPGVYTFNGSGNVNITSNLILSGSPSAVWIFQLPGNLNISSATSIILSGGAVPSNIFWAVAGTTTLQTTSTFEGNILAGPGTSTIAMQNGAILNGRALGQTNISLIGNTIVPPSGSVTPIPAVGIATATSGTSTITYTLVTGTFDSTAGIINSNWTLGGPNVADLGTISHVVLSAGNTVATITVTGAIASGNIYTVTPAPATFLTGFTTPGVTAITVTPIPIIINYGGTNWSSGGSSAPTSPNAGVYPVVTIIPVRILGCNNGTMGFSIASGQSCANNFVPTLPEAGITPTYDLGTALLVNGSHGAAVMELQRFLNANSNLNLVVDGDLGPKTFAAIKQWQTNNDLKADGMVGAKTKAKMNAVVQ
jgi:hypothetical protein